jgi:hypothetical protein
MNFIELACAAEGKNLLLLPLVDVDMRTISQVLLYLGVQNVAEHIQTILVRHRLQVTPRCALSMEKKEEWEIRIAPSSELWYENAFFPDTLVNFSSVIHDNARFKQHQLSANNNLVVGWKDLCDWLLPTCNAVIAGGFVMALAHAKPSTKLLPSSHVDMFLLQPCNMQTSLETIQRWSASRGYTVATNNKKEICSLHHPDSNVHIRVVESEWADPWDLVDGFDFNNAKTFLSNSTVLHFQGSAWHDWVRNMATASPYFTIRPQRLLSTVAKGITLQHREKLLLEAWFPSNHSINQALLQEQKESPSCFGPDPRAFVFCSNFVQHVSKEENDKNVYHFHSKVFLLITGRLSFPRNDKWGNLSLVSGTRSALETIVGIHEGLRKKICPNLYFTQTALQVEPRDIFDFQDIHVEWGPKVRFYCKNVLHQENTALNFIDRRPLPVSVVCFPCSMKCDFATNTVEDPMYKISEIHY